MTNMVQGGGPANAVEVESLSKVYRGAGGEAGKHALKGVSLAARAAASSASSDRTAPGSPP